MANYLSSLCVIFAIIPITFCQQCNMDYLHRNLSSILFIQSPKISLKQSEINVSDFLDNGKKSSNFCFNSKTTCCKTDIFDFLKVVIKPLLHKLSGQSVVHSNVYHFLTELKFNVMLLMDVLLYNIYKEIVPRIEANDVNNFITALRLFMHSDMRMKLAENYGNKLDIREAILSAFTMNRNEVICLSKTVYNNKDLAAFNERFEDVIDRSILRLYRHSMRLESIISQMQDIELTKECVDGLLNMVACGVCSQELDFTLYDTAQSNSTNIRICPKYCYNVIRQCMAYYLSLVTPLQFYQRNLLRFAGQYKTDLVQRYKMFWNVKSHFKIFADMILYIKDNIIQRDSEVCRDPLDVQKSIKDNDYLLDESDRLAKDTFVACVNENKCATLNRSSASLFAEILKSVDKFVVILNTNINTIYFNHNILAKSCDNNHYDRCWNGKEIGQYHYSVIRFNGSNPQLQVSLNTNQRDKINEISNSIYSAVKNLAPVASIVTVAPKEIEGSGNAIPNDDEDYETEKRVVEIPRSSSTINGSTLLFKTKSFPEIPSGNTNTSDIILQQSVNKNIELRIEVNFLHSLVMSIFCVWIIM